MLPFLGGATCGLAMSSLLWFGFTVLWDAVTTRRNETDALHPTSRAAIGGALMMLGLAPVLFMLLEQSWFAMQGYATAIIAMPFFVLIQLARGGK
jgi:hypothetical protein